MSGIIGSQKMVVPYIELEKQINDLNEMNAYVTHAEPVDKHDEKSKWNIYWRTSSFIETIREEVKENQTLTNKNFTSINESTEEDGPIKTKKINYYIRQLFKRLHI